jgi:excisionase family DNA binding protein
MKSSAAVNGTAKVTRLERLTANTSNDRSPQQLEAAGFPRLLTLREVAEILSIKEYRAAELVRKKILKGVYLGKQVRVNSEELRAFIASGGKTLGQLEDQGRR